MRIALIFACMLALVCSERTSHAEDGYESKVVNMDSGRFSGAYIGGHGAIVQSSSASSGTDIYGAGGPFDGNEPAYGAHAGYNWQLDNLIFGLEVAITNTEPAMIEPVPIPRFVYGID